MNSVAFERIDRITGYNVGKEAFRMFVVIRLYKEIVLF